MDVVEAFNSWMKNSHVKAANLGRRRIQCQHGSIERVAKKISLQANQVNLRSFSEFASFCQPLPLNAVSFGHFVGSDDFSWALLTITVGVSYKRIKYGIIGTILSAGPKVAICCICCWFPSKIICHLNHHHQKGGTGL